MLQHFMEKVHGVFVMAMLGMLKLLVLIVVHPPMLIIGRIVFQCYVRKILLVLIESLVYQIKSLVLTLVKQRQYFARVYIKMVIIVIILLTEKKPLSLKSIMETSIFSLSFVQESYLIDLVLLRLGKQPQEKLFMIFQSITILLINLTC